MEVIVESKLNKNMPYYKYSRQHLDGYFGVKITEKTFIIVEISIARIISCRGLGEVSMGSQNVARIISCKSKCLQENLVSHAGDWLNAEDVRILSHLGRAVLRNNC